MIRLLLILLSCFTPPLQASWLALCDGQLPAQSGDYRFNSADGSVKNLRLLEHEPSESCVTTVLPVSADALQWFTQLNAGQAAQIEQSRAVILQGAQNGKHFTGEVSLDNGAAPPPPHPLPWPLFLELRDHLEIRPFGQEERAHFARSDAGIAFHCLAGLRPAGFVLHIGHNLLPQLPKLSLSLALHGDSGFTWNASQADANRDPLTLAALQGRSADIDLAPMLQAQNTWDSWTLLCPQAKANLTLKSLQLTAPTSTPPGRATWIWRETGWRQADAALWKKLAKLNITTLYITVPLNADLSHVANMQTLQAFIKQADRQGVGVWAVAGDPQAVLASERESWLKRAQAYAAYNRDAPQSARLKGVQYDIEPYLAPGYAQAPEVWLQAYVDTLAALRKASPLPLEVAVPVWWAEQTLNGKPLLEAMTPWLDSVTVMDYRTDPWRIQQQALAFLSWAASHGKTVRIALEAGPVAEETRLVFRRAESGNLWHIRVGETSLLLRLATPGVNPIGAAFNLTDQLTVSGAAVSFHSRPDEMAKRLPQLERALSAWPTFGGLALHELLKP